MKTKKSKLEQVLDAYEAAEFAKRYPGLQALKELYSEAITKNLVYYENPFLDTIPKGEEFSGSIISVPLKTPKKP